jgi:DNA-binding NarL/FixJ family response regulator
MQRLCTVRAMHFGREELLQFGQLVRSWDYTSSPIRPGSRESSLVPRSFTEIPMVQVFIVDDFKAFRRYVASTLREQPGLQVICEASDGLEAVQKAAELRPDLIVLDVGLPKLNGLAAAEQILKLSPKSRILFLSVESSPDVVRAAFKVGAWGYVVKMDAEEELIAAVAAVLRGKKFVGSRFAQYNFTT